MSEEQQTGDGAMTVIGVSFGNANSSISFTGSDGNVDIIANQDGDRSIPSTLAYVKEDEYHGLQAKAQLIRNSKNTVTNFRDYIGKQFSEIDPTYSHRSAHPVENAGKVGYQLDVLPEEGAEPKFFSVEEVAQIHLRRLRESAEDFLGKPVTGAVLTVPTDFTQKQREELKQIATEAGIPVMQIVSEPVAALLAYDSVTYGAFPKDRIVVVADFGYTRSDAAVIAVRGGMYTVLATAHNYELGGASLDETLADHFAKEFEKKNGIDPRKESARSIAKLIAECEVTRKTLSNSNSSTISIESLAGGFDFHSTINRLRFEMLARKQFDNAVSLVEDVVKKAGLDVLDVDEVVLVGGSAQTPKILSRIEAIFPETTKVASPSGKALNPAELIARGAAVQASLIAGFEQSDIDESLQPLVANAPHLAKSVGVVTADGSFVPVLESYTAVPIRHSAVFEVPAEGGDVLVGIYEGEREIVTRKVESIKEDKDEEDDLDDEEEFSDEEDEETREKVLKPATKLAEAVVKGTKAGGKVEVVINITADLKVSVAVREVGSGAVRGELPAAEVQK
ncbi:putative Hsp70 chaperone [Myxozyma melibiosi]|uniref:Hsp70 chaperone n=1 Tax=Myxozyma melibiosi TaxID=54550 RepID=A0ABR1FCW9_9ASCO